MEENKVENIEVNGEENKTEGQSCPQEVVIQQPGIGKKILKGVCAGAALVAAFLGGLFLGGRSKGNDENDSEESEGPKDE